MKKKSVVVTSIILSVILLFTQQCLAKEKKFAQVGGTKNANLHGIKVYQGAPPENIKYKSLGTVYAEGKRAFAVMKFDNGLEKLTLQAKETGANAIIKWRVFGYGFNMKMDGEAIIFEEFPETLE